MTPVLIRVAGLPLSSWLAAANEALFAEISELEARHGKYRLLATELAEQLGHSAIPAPEFGSEDRAALLDIRRRLHSGESLDESLAAEADRLLRKVDRLRPLAADVARAVERGRAVDNACIRAYEALEAEQARLRTGGWRVVAEQPAAYSALRQANPEVVQDIERRLSMGEPWQSKRMRQRADYLWRMITRGSARATPRGLLGQLALVPVADRAARGAMVELDCEFSLEWTDNVFERNGVPAQVAPDQELVLTPLHWQDGDHIRFLVRRAGDASRLHELQVRDTPQLRAVRAAVHRRGRTTLELVDELAPPDADDRVRQAVAGFAQHLVKIGVLETAEPMRRELTRWEHVPAGRAVRSGGYVDTFRRPLGPLAAADVRELATLADRALRVLAVIDSSVPAQLPDAEPRPVLELLAERLQFDGPDEPEAPHPHDWLDARAADPDSEYGRLVSWLTGRFAAGTRSVDLDDAPDVRGTPAPELSWPVDCLLRPIHDGEGAVAVLDRFEPAGTLDSRFAETLAELEPAGAERLAHYRAFLAEVERQGGGRFVELLVPSMGVRAANAVRRPAYTSLWTGDPNRRLYIGDSTRPAEFVPLSEITLGTRHGRVEAAAAGQLIWPVVHATRSAPKAWDELSALLLRGSLRPTRGSWRALGWTLPGWPERRWIPRLTVGAGALVLAPEQWRLSLAHDWSRHASTLAKCQQLNRWRSELGIPRWISVTSEVHADPVPCDLASVQTVALLDRYLRQGTTELMAAELLPNPDQVLVRDHAHGGVDGSMAELLLRLPTTSDASLLARRASTSWRERGVQHPPSLVAAGLPGH